MTGDLQVLAARELEAPEFVGVEVMVTVTGPGGASKSVAGVLSCAASYKAGDPRDLLFVDSRMPWAPPHQHESEPSVDVVDLYLAGFQILVRADHPVLVAVTPTALHHPV